MSASSAAIQSRDKRDGRSSGRIKIKAITDAVYMVAIDVAAHWYREAFQVAAKHKGTPMPTAM